MEANREEAKRAQAMAEEKIKKADYHAAKRLAIKAQSLDPALKDSISQLIAMSDIYISYGNNPDEEADWYRVLNVDPSSDEDTIRKQFRKLALKYHPDKNQSVGAEGAFMIISEANAILTDSIKRLEYEGRRARRLQQNVSLHAQTAGYHSHGVHHYRNRTSTPNGPHHFSNGTCHVPMAEPQFQATGTSNGGSKPNSVPKAQSSRTKPKKRKPSQAPNTFWTTCNNCKFHYEFVRLYMNGNLLCDNCHKAFVAKETAPPPGYPENNVHCQQNQVPGDKDSNQNAPGQDTNVSDATNDLGKKAPAAKRPKQGPSPNPLDRGKNVASAERSGPGPNAHGKNVASAERSGTGPNAHGKNVPSGNNSRPELNRNVHGPEVNVEADKSGVDQEKVPYPGTANGTSRGHPTGSKAGRVTQDVLNNLKRAHGEGSSRVGSQEPLKQQKLDDTRRKMMNYMANANGCSGRTSRTRDVSLLDHRKMMMAKSQMGIRSKVNVWKREERGFSIGTEKHDENGKSGLSTNGTVDKKVKEPMIVPDPDFYDFDNDRTERSFGDNEVWSAYDDKDGMPRLYALIHKVDSRNPFKLTISWLNSKTNAEFSTMDWVSSGFYKTCGEFWVGKYEPFRSINAFSQKVSFSKSKRGSVLIFPQKDEVWALYKNWSSEWDRRTPKDVVQKYDMVKVLDDYNEENGISVAPLVKVVGFKTVFRPELDPRVIRRVPKEEMLRFSHRVPHHVLTGQESQNAPRGCLELDPASTPLELQVMTEANKAVSPSQSSVGE